MASWKETLPGRFERPFDSIERFLLAMARANRTFEREHWTISALTRFEMQGSQRDVESALRHAWKTMRYDHPQLACTEHEGVKIYRVPDDAALEAWLKETFVIEPASTSKDDLFASFRPSGLATLHFWPQTSEFIIHSSHWRIDFIGALGLLQNLFCALEKPRQIRFGDEGKNLSLGRDEAGDYKSLADLGSRQLKEEQAKLATDLLMQYVGNLPSMGLPAQNIHRTPRGTRHSKIILDPGLTQAIISASKRRGYTVTAAFHAALIIVLQQLNPSMSSSPSTYTSIGIFNIRPLLKPPYNILSIHPVAVYAVGLPLVLHASTYTSHSTQLNSYYQGNLLTLADVQTKEGILASYTHQLADIAGQDPTPEVPLPTEPILSSIGIIDGYLRPDYGTIKVKEFWAGVEMTTPQVACHVWTWQGQMTVSVSYNETFYEKNVIEDFLKRTMNVLRNELETELS